jgi:Protein of unknown function (DUF1214)
VYRGGDRLFFPDALYDEANNTYRYNINDKTQGFDFNGGKNFTIYMSTTPPPVGSKIYRNWIPIGKVPDSKFSVYLRLYGPDEATVNGTWYPPPLIAHKGTWGARKKVAGWWEGFPVAFMTGSRGCDHKSVYGCWIWYISYEQRQPGWGGLASQGFSRISVDNIFGMHGFGGYPEAQRFIRRQLAWSLKAIANLSFEKDASTAFKLKLKRKFLRWRILIRRKYRSQKLKSPWPTFIYLGHIKPILL